MIVHGGRGSMFVRKVHVALREKGIPYGERPLVPVPKTPELMAMHPLGKIPVLELDDGTFVPDSSVICLYLEKVFPEIRLYPTEATEYARALFLEEYADTKLFEVAGGVFVERFVKPRIFGTPTDEACVHQLVTQELPPVCDWLERQLHSDRASILERFSIADVAIGAHLTALTASGERIDGRRWPRLARYVDALWARPSFVDSAP